MNAVIFDMDGVIVNTVPDHVRIWSDVCDRFGCSMTRELFDELNGMDTSMIARILVDRFHIDYDPVEITDLKHKIANETLKHGVVLFEGVGETIDEIRLQGLKIGLATSSPRDQAEIDLAGKGLNFDCTVTIDDVMRPKPEPDIFMKCAECMEIPYADCLVVEDSINGIAAAKKAGMKAVAITTTTNREKFQADAIIDNIRELPKIIQIVFQK